MHNCHVMDTQDYNDMKGFVATMKKEGGRQRNNPGVFALDCEMCCTLRGNELTRVTVVDCHGKTVYESVVKPDSEIIDYNTRLVQYFFFCPFRKHPSSLFVHVLFSPNLDSAESQVKILMAFELH